MPKGHNNSVNRGVERMQHHRYSRLTPLAFGIAGALSLGQAHASGFQLKENSAKAWRSAA